MDLQLVKKGVLDYTRKKKRWVALCAALGFSGYAVYRVYHLPSISQKRKRFSKLLGALISIAEVISDSAETIGVVSKDLKVFLQSESDRIPNSLKQISKVTRSPEFSESVISLTQALTMGILRGYQTSSRIDDDVNADRSISFLDKVFDKLSTPAGSGFVSVVVGSFARNLVLGLYQDRGNSSRGVNSNSECNGSCTNDYVDLEMNSDTKFVDVICGTKCRDLIGNCIQLFVSTAVAVYLDKTMHINTYDEIFAGLTNPKHEKKVTDVLVSVCNGAISTLVKTSHEVLMKDDSESSSRFASPILAIDQGVDASEQELSAEEEEIYGEPERRKSFGEAENGGWVGKVSSTLAVPSNRRLFLDVTGRITFETVRSFLEFLVEKLCDGIKRCIDIVDEAAVEIGVGVVRFLTAKSSVIVAVCLSLFLHITDGAWVMVPA